MQINLERCLISKELKAMCKFTNTDKLTHDIYNQGTIDLLMRIKNWTRAISIGQKFNAD